MKIGVQINRFDFPGDQAAIGTTLEKIAQAAEAAGVYSLWVMDHFFQIAHIGDYKEPMLEAYTTLGYLAGVTNKALLGTMVTGVIYREPAVLLKAVTTLDVVSGGRAYLGIGAGWNDQEAKALGLLDPLNAKRFLRLEDTLKLFHQTWSGDYSTFKGDIYSLPEPYLNPMPVHQPHPPILIGGGGEEKTLRLVAKYADATNLFAQDEQLLAHKLDVLKSHCQEIGRDYGSIEKTALAGVSVKQAAETPDVLLKKAERLSRLGIEHLILAVDKEAEIEHYRALEQPIKDLAQLTP